METHVGDDLSPPKLVRQNAYMRDREWKILELLEYLRMTMDLFNMLQISVYSLDGNDMQKFGFSQYREDIADYIRNVMKDRPFGVQLVIGENASKAWIIR